MNHFRSLKALPRKIAIRRKKAIDTLTVELELTDRIRHLRRGKVEHRRVNLHQLRIFTANELGWVMMKVGRSSRSRGSASGIDGGIHISGSKRDGG